MKQFKRLEEYAKYNRILFTPQEQERFQKFCELLLEKNKVLNLTAIEDLDEIEVKHFIDSVSAAPLICSLIMGVDLHNLKIKPTDYHLYSSQNSDTHGLRAQEMGLQLAPPLEAKNVGFVGMSINAATPQPVNLIDIGTGAGFPGIPLKIVLPDLECVLLDSLNKRIDFVNDSIAQLGLEGITGVAARAEDYAKVGSVSRETFDFCVTRAVAHTAVLAEYCLPLVRVGGHCVFYKSGNYEEELQEAEQAIAVMGGVLHQIENIQLPETDAKRSLIVLKKVAPTPEKYPRRAGKPSKSPIKK